MSRKNLAILATGAILLFSLFQLLQPKKSDFKLRPSGNSTPLIQVGNQSTSSANFTTKTFEIRVKDKKLVDTPEVIQVKEGDYVTLNISSDSEAEDKLHLHGYDKSVALKKDKPESLNFAANLTGRFVYELENSKIELGAIEVLPK